MKNANEFKAKLRALLAEYNASIGFECGEASDLHGVYDERIIVMIGDTEHVLADGYCVEARDLTSC